MPSLSTGKNCLANGVEMEAARILITRFILIDKSLEREISLQGKCSHKLLFNTLQLTRCKTTLGNDYTFAAVPQEPSTLI